MKMILWYFLIKNSILFWERKTNMLFDCLTESSPKLHIIKNSTCKHYGRGIANVPTYFLFYSTKESFNMLSGYKYVESSEAERHEINSTSLAVNICMLYCEVAEEGAKIAF